MKKVLKVKILYAKIYLKREIGRAVMNNNEQNNNEYGYFYNGDNNGSDNGQNNNQGGFNNQGEPNYAYRTVMNPRPKTMAWSVVSLIFGIIATVCCCFGWSGMVLGVISVVAAVISRKKLGYFDGLSIAGLVLGIFGFCIGAVMLIGMNSLPDEFWDDLYKGLEDGYEQGTNGI